MPLSLRSAYFQYKKACALFLCRKEVNQLLEALEKIRQAEENNAQKAKKLQQELSEYATQKNKEIEALQAARRQQLTKLSEEKEQAEQQTLEAEKELLLKEAAEIRENLEKRYEQHQEQATNAIIERVKQLYGRH
jgi:V/A-type H+-transporting ATPase subunit G/H